ncbi:AbrB/MazE/SpoVT family DNA-binding domain-containing protein [Fictibacillus terranigra]|uniref:AbrB/MazE/SpoVT family DNA-binding domain-containing protein n=1 Tax=Fictibacillus terranigra TaxID=3058424 RepID=A0ABT8EDD1_9BACL|nr:AbrB/MazE/SpoVT family DNA-binding domain-containing protein [Fictibacillus sp. CENA-BCM004]MDN4075914.1 AbrB/MazE/SpoVT family DNA-binding domain-containing protein [Fictibacillus sp. CENA-BCM004]
MEVEGKIRKIGNSLGVLLPSFMAKSIGIEEGDSVYIRVENDAIKISCTPNNDQEDYLVFKKKVIAIVEEYLQDREQGKKPE